MGKRVLNAQSGHWLGQTIGLTLACIFVGTMFCVGLASVGCFREHRVAASHRAVQESAQRTMEILSAHCPSDDLACKHARQALCALTCLPDQAGAAPLPGQHLCSACK